jgi:hypothetical protein
MIIPNIWKNKIHVPNQQPVNYASPFPYLQLSGYKLVAVLWRRLDRPEAIDVR